MEPKRRSLYLPDQRVGICTGIHRGNAPYLSNGGRCRRVRRSCLETGCHCCCLPPRPDGKPFFFFFLLDDYFRNLGITRFTRSLQRTMSHAPSSRVKPSSYPSMQAVALGCVVVRGQSLGSETGVGRLVEGSFVVVGFCSRTTHVRSCRSHRTDAVGVVLVVVGFLPCPPPRVRPFHPKIPSRTPGKRVKRRPR